MRPLSVYLAMCSGFRAKQFGSDAAGPWPGCEDQFIARHGFFPVLRRNDNGFRFSRCLSIEGRGGTDDQGRVGSFQKLAEDELCELFRVNLGRCRGCTEDAGRENGSVWKP